MPLIEYQEGKSLMHKISPIGKFLWGMIIVLWLFIMFEPLHVLALGIVILGVAKWGANLSILKLLRSTVIVGLAGISIIFWQAIFYRNGTPIFTWGPIAPSYEGFMVGLAIALRVLGIVAASTIIAKTTDPRDIFLAMVKVGIPYKIAYGLFTALRFIPLMEYESGIILDAQYVRGVAVKKGGLVSQAKRFSYFLIPLIASAMRRADQSAMAMEVRAFGLHKTRTYSRELDIQRQEWLFLAVWIALFLIYLVVFHENVLGAVFYNPPSVEPWE